MTPGIGEHAWIPEKQCDFTAAAQEVDNKKLVIPGNLQFRTVEALRNHANAHGTAKKQAQRFNEASKALTGLNEPQLVQQLRQQVVEEFHDVFQRVRLHDPTEFGIRRYFFGNNVFAETQDIAGMASLAAQGHTYAQYMSGLLSASQAGALTQAAVEFFLAAHAQDFPQALPALAERLLANAYYSDALQSAVLAVAGGYRDARSIVDDLAREIGTTLLETPHGLVPFLPFIVGNVIEPEVRELLFKQRPDWRPRTQEQVLETMFGRRNGGASHD